MPASYRGKWPARNGKSLLRSKRRANRARVKTGTKANLPDAPPAASGGDDFAADWREVRGDDDIQFSEVPMPEAPPPPDPPDWLSEAMQALGEFLSPVGEGLVAVWPELKWVLLAAGIALIALILWRLFGPDLAARRGSSSRYEGEFQVDQQAALSLLEDADRLAAEGRFDEATHLLLMRSVGQIAAARPDLVEPSSTAREIAAQPSLPAAARSAFAVIATRVERSLFALRRLSADDWQAARAAYAEFALAERGLRA